MAWPTTVELFDLVARFRTRTLPKAEWTHHAHLAVGCSYVREHGAPAALDQLRGDITRLNESHGTVNDDHGGYHETITGAYVRLIAGFLHARRERPLAACVQELLAGPLAAKTALLAHYTKERLDSVAARRGFLEPDRAPLPDPASD